MLLGISEVDGFAIAMIAILGTSFSFVALILFAVIRSARRSNREVEDLLDEVNQDEPTQPAGDRGKDEPPAQPWEKKADWWQKDD
ncbi:hypothetical protein [Haloferula sp.]|uniref:hypothetical protein n=1 Tax=Haloferula sp. TaxID=2497595 RepID=UPI003C78B388